MQKFIPIRMLPKNIDFAESDTVVIFGEVFQRGYVNGLIDEALSKGMKVIYATVGRRDENNELRSLNEQELKEKNQSPLINIALEAGFDLEAAKNGQSPCDQLSNVKLKTWKQTQLDWDAIEQSKQKGHQRFKAAAAQYMNELAPYLEQSNKVLFVHTMAGGVPRTKIVMPLLNRVFKGHGERFQSSEEFWQQDIGKLTAQSFEEVTSTTYQDLIDVSAELRERIQSRGGKVSYVAYGYHGNELLIDGSFTWQSYSPYLTGFAKLKLEQVAHKAQEQNINAYVFNAPEILTNSSSLFLGIEVALYPLLRALNVEGQKNIKVAEITKKAQDLLKSEYSLEDIYTAVDSYFKSDLIKNQWSDYNNWPQHNGPEQMIAMRETSLSILDMHADQKQLMTNILSEIVFKACGHLMLHYPWQDSATVSWIGHDIVAKHFIDSN